MGADTRRWPLCDKCGKACRPHNNIYFVGVASGEIEGYGILLCRNRHFLPEDGCEGSPSRAQYIDGQPRDARLRLPARLRGQVARCSAPRAVHGRNDPGRWGSERVAVQ